MIPALVVEPAETKRLASNPRRAAFYCGAVASLGRDLAALGTTLVVRRGPLVKSVVRLVRESGVRAVTWAAAYDAAGIERHRALQAALEEDGVRATIVHVAPAVAPDDTAAARAADGGVGYRALAPYVAAWLQQERTPVIERVSFAAHAFASDPAPQPADYGAAGDVVAPSAATALAELDAYLSGPVLQYPIARNVPAGTPTSRTSAALSFGVIGARTIAARIAARARDPFLLAEERVALGAFERALAQRDFFLQLAWFFESAPDAVLQSRMRTFPFARRHAALQRWRDGTTGVPFVDAGIRELHATGWMHPRARIVAASFLCFDLGVDWRIGRDTWDAHLIEDEPALATGNWQWVAGVGADLAQFPRIYNPRKQGRRFDPLGRYARRWIPELDHAEADPYAAAGVPRLQLALPLFGADAYPSPAVDHEKAARAFLKRYAAFVETTPR